MINNDIFHQRVLYRDGSSENILYGFTKESPLLHETDFMKLHRRNRNNYDGQKFVDLFPETKNSNPTDFVFFVSSKGEYGFLSNWYRESEGHRGEGGLVFPTVEHHLMFKKAQLFDDRSNVSHFKNYHSCRSQTTWT